MSSHDLDLISAVFSSAVKNSTGQGSEKQKTTASTPHAVTAAKAISSVVEELKPAPKRSCLDLMTLDKKKNKKAKTNDAQEPMPVDAQMFTTSTMNTENPEGLSMSGSSDARSEQEDRSLLCLPYHVLTDGIMTFLRPEDIASFTQCNTVSKRIGEEGYLWQSMFRSRFPSSELSPRAMQEWKLAYQLKLSNIVNHLRCFHTKKNFFDDVLGVGVDYTINPKTKLVDHISVTQDLLSKTAFRQHNVRRDVFGNKFKLFLPLYFSEDHFQRALPQIKLTVQRLCPHHKAQSFEPSMILDVFPKIMTTFVVLLSDEGVSASRKSFNGLCRIHRLFMALSHEYPSIKKEATIRLKLFAAQEKYRVKSACPNLGAILPLFMIVDKQDFEWRDIMPVYLGETFDRGVLWVCKRDPRMEITRGPNGKEESPDKSDYRVDVTREVMTVTLRLLMFQVYFIHAFCQGTTVQRASRYDCFFGQLDPELKQQAESGEQSSLQGGRVDTALEGMTTTGSVTPNALNFTSFRDQINSILTVSTWQQFFHFIGSRAPATKADMARVLRQSVTYSRRKGYHKKGMDFSRVQKSGTSKILSKGQEYSASSNLKQVVFRDVWGFCNGVKYLDASCLLYNAARSRVCTVDFMQTQAENGAVRHSGDIIREDGGTHTIQLDLQALEKDITTCVFVISAYNGAKLSDIISPSIFVTDANTGASLCSYDLDAHDKIPHLTSVIMCKLYRSRKGGWHVQAIGDAHRGAANDYGPIYEAVEKLL